MANLSSHPSMGMGDDVHSNPLLAALNPEEQRQLREIEMQFAKHGNAPFNFGMQGGDDGVNVSNITQLQGLAEFARAAQQSNEESSKAQDVDASQTSGGDASGGDRRKKRQKWTFYETTDLVDGCYEYGVGAWKKILNDPKYHFINRTPVDLKDRFRTIYPAEYKRLYPESKRVAQPKKEPEIQPPPFTRVGRRKRHPFTPEEDQSLIAGVNTHGVAWAKIAKDPRFNLSHRRSTDLRDRFRNAFPKDYDRLGYMPRPRSKGPGSDVSFSQGDASQLSLSSSALGNVLNDMDASQSQNLLSNMVTMADDAPSVLAPNVQGRQLRNTRRGGKRGRPSKAELEAAKSTEDMVE